MFLQLLSDSHCGLYLHKFFNAEIQTYLENIGKQQWNNFSITYDKIRKMFIFPRDTLNSFYERLEPYCRKKKINLVGVPEFVFKFIENLQYKEPKPKMPKGKKGKKRVSSEIEETE